MSDRECPSRAELTSFCLGDLAVATIEGVASHLEDCASCQATVEALGDVTDPLLDRLRADHEQAAAIDEDVLIDVLLHEAQESACTQETNRPTDTQSAVNIALAEAKTPTRVGQYQLLDILGVGGMGAVFRAEHVKLKKAVALKILPKAYSPQSKAVERFYREVESAGRLDHPNVVSAYDAGKVGRTHYLAMEYIGGVDLATLADPKRTFPLAEACEIVRQVALGLQYIHDNKLVHRDVKPSNVIVSKWGDVKIVDLGLALFREEQQRSELTETGQIVGTRSYMAPEQKVDSHDVDVRADIYSLGATLYRLVTGRAPKFPRHDSQRSAAIVSALQESRPEIGDDLATIVSTMLAVDPSDRVASAQQVATSLEPFAAGAQLTRLFDDVSFIVDDSLAIDPEQTATWLEEFIHIEAVQEVAHKPQVSATPQRKLSDKQLVMIGAAAISLIVAATIAVLLLLPKPTGDWGTVVIHLHDPLVNQRLKDGDVQVVNASTGEKHTLNAGSNRLPTGTYYVEISGGDVAVELPEFEVKEEEREVRIGLSTYGVANSPYSLVSRPVVLDDTNVWTIETRAHRGAIQAISYSPDGKWFVSAGQDAVVRIWDTGDHSKMRALIGHVSPITAVCWSPDGKLLITGDGDGEIRVWDPRTGRLFDHHRTKDWPVRSLACSGDRLAANTGKAGVRVWEVSPESRLTGEKIVGSPGKALAWSPIGDALAIGSSDGWVHMWAEGEPKGTQLPTNPRINAIAWPEHLSMEKKLLVCGENGELIEVNSETLEPGPVINTGARHALSAAVSPSGHSVAFGEAGPVLVWDVAGRRVRATFTTGSNSTIKVAWSNDPRKGDQLATGGHDGILKFWDVERNKETDSIIDKAGRIAGAQLAKWSPDGKFLAVAGDRWLRLWAAKTGQALAPLAHDASRPLVSAVGWSTDSSFVASADEGGRLALWRAGDWKRSATLESLDEVTKIGSLQWSPDGAWIASGSIGGVVQIWDVAKRQRKGNPVRLGLNVTAVRWSPDGKRVAALSGDQLHIVDAAENTQQLGFKVRTSATTLIWIDDKTILASAPSGGLQSWDVETGTQLREYASGWIDTVALARDGSLLATSSISDDAIQVWDFSTGEQLRELVGHRRRVSSLAWHPDEKTLVSASTDGTVRVWDVDKGRVHAVLLPRDDGQSWTVSAAGNYAAPQNADDQMIVVVQTDEGQSTHTMKDFSTTYKWRNDGHEIPLAQAGP